MSIRVLRENQDRYISERMALSRGRDDRCERSKLNADAKLRGQIGASAANRIIKQIDAIKSWR